MVSVPQNTCFKFQIISTGTSKEEPRVRLTTKPGLASAALFDGWRYALLVAQRRQARALVALAIINISLSVVPSLSKPSCMLCQGLRSVLSCAAIFCTYRAPKKMTHWEERSSPAVCWPAMRRRTETIPRAVPYQGPWRNS